MDEARRDGVVTRARGIAARELDGEVVVVTPSTQSIHFFNPTAVALWKLIDGARTIGDLARALCERFEVPEEQALTDVLEFIEALESQGVVAVSGSSSKDEQGREGNEG